MASGSSSGLRALRVQGLGISISIPQTKRQSLITDLFLQRSSNSNYLEVLLGRFDSFGSLDFEVRRTDDDLYISGPHDVMDHNTVASKNKPAQTDACC